MSPDTTAQETRPIVLKVLLRGRHLQSYRAFCREYDKVAEKVDKSLRGSFPSKAQFYRWLSGELVGLPYADHCRILEAMLPGWQAEQLFEFHDGGIEFVPEPTASPTSQATNPPSSAMEPRGNPEVVEVFSHRSAIPADLWTRLLDDSGERIDILCLAALFLVERPTFAKHIKQKASDGAKIRLLFGDPDADEATKRSEEERLDARTVSARIRNALAFLRPLDGVPGVEARLHTTTLYNSVFRFDDEMVINTHVYGLPGAHAPALHLRQTPKGDMFETYMESFETVWAAAKPLTW
ncbi:XRE family transcriptional regulator [Amycolatopsis thailandensis]|uniref:XRE family transcriptional regulator n=1 Tax=Amycolatopsis thailandensis TaxID=589330 RepID=UPI0036699E32